MAIAELIPSALQGLAISAALAFGTWLLSLMLRDVSIVDSAWSLLVLAAASVYAMGATSLGARGMLLLALTTTWSLRLFAHITHRNWGEPEDRRYRAIRDRNQPGFAWKSLYLVFGLQAVLAWIVSLPLLAAFTAAAPLQSADAIGIALALFGLVFESIGDWQLTRFTAHEANRGRVMDSGLWRYTRHPNYFGECCLWWGVYLLALPAGGWWTIVSPVLLTVLLLKVSGVVLLEKDIADRRPAYRDYVARTNAFFPGMPRGERR